MKTAALVLISLSLAASGVAQTWQPNVTNAKFETRAYSGNLATQLHAAAPAWFGYAERSARSDNGNCCWNGSSGCWLEQEHGKQHTAGAAAGSPRPVQLEGSDAIAVLFRVANDGIEKLRVYSLSCPLDAGGLPFVWLTGVPEQASLAFLKTFVTNGGHNADAAVFAISQHAGPEADSDLIEIANRDPSGHVRGQALFWLAQKAGNKAAAAITNAIQNDPDTEVKKKAVFALSQLPKDEGVPKLIEVAKTQRNPAVRKQAFFWLGQSHDPRALAFIEQVLTK